MKKGPIFLIGQAPIGLDVPQLSLVVRESVRRIS